MSVKIFDLDCYEKCIAECMEDNCDEACYDKCSYSMRVDVYVE